MAKDSDCEEVSRDHKSRHKHRCSRSDSSEKSSSSSSLRKTVHKKYKSRRNSKSRSRSRSKERNSKSSRQRSRKSRSPQSRRRHQMSRSRSRDKKVDKVVSKQIETGTNSLITADMSTEEQLRIKMQMALKAAAEADAQLRQKGILPPGGKKNDMMPKDKLSQPKPDERSIQEQFYRTKAIDTINAPGFEQQAFKSDRSLPHINTSTSQPDDHSTIIFGSSLESRAVENRIKLTPNAVLDQLVKDQLIHENLFADVAAKQERWIRKLYLMRQKRLNGEIMS